jgi:hypothetical protein
VGFLSSSRRASWLILAEHTHLFIGLHLVRFTSSDPNLRQLICYFGPLRLFCRQTPVEAMDVMFNAGSRTSVPEQVSNPLKVRTSRLIC